MKADTLTLVWRSAFVVVPLVGLVELGLHVFQTHDIPREGDWLRARDEVRAMIRSDDLLVFAPMWADPLGREYFGEALATVEREARPDDTRFPRAIEVSMRGKHLPELKDWPVSATERVGPFAITTYRNPTPVVLRDDLITHMASGKIKVFRVDGATALPCVHQHVAPQSGNVGFGPGVPGDKFQCVGGSFVGVTVLPDLDYVPHQCFFSPPPGGRSTLRIAFDEVKFGRALHGHHAISVHSERDLTGSPVTLTFKIEDRVIGHFVHRDGDSWKGFEADTREWEGTSGTLIAEVSSENAAARQYCFEADTR